jgi:uncharacterized protein (TIGR02246 family)
MPMMLLAALLCGAPGPATAAASPTADTASIKKLFADFIAAGNNHDARAVTALLTEDAVIININNEVRRGSAELGQRLTQLFAGPLKTLHYDATLMEIRFLNPSTAIVISEYVRSGILNADGSPVPPKKGLEDWVVTEQNGRWLISLRREADSPQQPAAVSAPAQ